jgi:hypothetical protein
VGQRYQNPFKKKAQSVQHKPQAPKSLVPCMNEATILSTPNLCNSCIVQRHHNSTRPYKLSGQPHSVAPSFKRGLAVKSRSAPSTTLPTSHHKRETLHHLFPLLPTMSSLFTVSVTSILCFLSNGRNSAHAHSGPFSTT